jgi:hypothetical protein
MRPVFGLGKGGIGKTESVRDLAINKLKIGYIDIRLLLYAETDLKGIPYPNTEHTKTIWLKNDVLPTVEKDGEKGILVLDEITSVGRGVRTAAYQLLSERRLGEYELPEGWMVVCLGNGEEDGGDFEGMEANFANRCSIFNIVPDIETWKQWAFSHNVNYLVTAYLSFRPSDLHTFNPNSDSNLAFASPRSWEAVSNVLNHHPYTDGDKITELRILSNIGTDVGNLFLAFCRYKKTCADPEDILSGVKLTYSPENREMVYMSIHGVSKLLTEVTDMDMSNYKSISTATMLKWANAIRWILGLSQLEYRIMGIKDLISSNRTAATQLLLNKDFNKLVPELKQFVTENSQVFRH